MAQKTLWFRVTLPQRYRGTTQGLLGNFDEDMAVEFVSRDNTTLPAEPSEQEFYDFGQSCKLLDGRMKFLGA